MSMNIFRISGDMSHVIGILILLWKVLVNKNAFGVSLRTQETFLLVFLARYLDLFTSFYSVYNTALKVFYLTSAATIICVARFLEPIKSTYKKGHDTFLYWECAVIPSAILAGLCANYEDGIDLIDLLWQFSIILEVFGIIPQAIVSLRCSEAECFARNFMFFMGAYRALYIVNWIYRAHTERGYRHHFVVYACGVLETLVYVVFFILFFNRSPQGETTVNQTEVVHFFESRDSYWYERCTTGSSDDNEATSDIAMDDVVYVALQANDEGDDDKGNAGESTDSTQSIALEVL